MYKAEHIDRTTSGLKAFVNAFVVRCPSCHAPADRQKGQQLTTLGASVAKRVPHTALHPGFVPECAECRAECIAVVQAKDAGFAVGHGKHRGLVHVCCQCGHTFSDPGHGLQLKNLSVTKCGIGSKGLRRLTSLPSNLPSLRVFDFDTD
eukprot:SAG31_NODE_2346_length_5902_cov_23.293814_3_plen_149_part_00